jgi:hypothetical protein
MKMTTKKWYKVSVNKKAKTIRFTQNIYNTQSEGIQMLSGKTPSFMILNKAKIDKMVTDGYTIVGVTEVLKSSWTPQFIVGGEIEEQIRAYTERKMRQEPVRFVRNAGQFTEKSWEQSTISHDEYQKKLSSVGASSMKKSYDKAINKYLKIK